ncbi:hypothetical protein D0Y65_020696 [Glycine soja]|uniref:TIR domain-containing protein n=1 Tax=Glycine soja TaxID=3848 RepID=A0A445JFB1_GLYSO|nr:hypothetical protein D0Y65_020696 [Glycine soja]
MSSSASEAQTHAMVFLAISTRLFMTEEFTLSLITRIFGVDIVVLSNNYASSLFCLDELAYTLECRERKNLLVLPIFYNLNPSHVRHQKEAAQGWKYQILLYRSKYSRVVRSTKQGGPSTAFWFHNKFPARVLCLLIAPVLYFKRPKVFINGEVQESCFDRGDQKEVRLSELDNTYLFGLQKISFVDKLFQVPFELEWNHVEVTYEKQHLQNTFVLLSFPTYKNSNRAIRGGALESTRDATIANREHLSDYLEVRDELLTLGD